MNSSAVYDFHMHTFLSDGVLLPIELIRRCLVNGYAGLAIADHTSASTMHRVLAEVARDCALAREYWGFDAIPATELTHVPAASIAALAAEAKAAGAALVVVHGESPVEPVEPGTNLAAASCPDVDILAHPGLLTPEAAEAARENGVFIEITSRQGHGMANGHVVKVALAAGAELVVNSDTHRPEDILTARWAEHVARCAGVPEDLLAHVLKDNPRALLARAQARLQGGGSV
jgi:histidinol phosphatase-like PHP family hydrolase